MSDIRDDVREYQILLTNEDVTPNSPEERIKERMEYFKREGEDLMRMRKSGHLPEPLEA